jgi:hypothetical protein
MMRLPAVDPFRATQPGGSRRKFLGAAAGLTAGAALWPRLSLASEDHLWKLYARYITGGVSYPASYPTLFLDPMFVQIDIQPFDFPNALNFLRSNTSTPPPPPAKTPSGLAPVGNAPIVEAEDNPPDVPWIPSTEVTTGVRKLMPGGNPVVNVMILNDQSEWPENFRALVQQAAEDGMGFVVIHNALGDNQTWPWWYEELTGGRLILADQNGAKKSVVTPKVSLELRAVSRHPIVQDIGPLHFANEDAYKGMWQSPKITPLIETSSSASDRVVAWIGPHAKARVVCIQPGAASETHRDPEFRKLVRNAILWAGGRLE